MAKIAPMSKDSRIPVPTAKPAPTTRPPETRTPKPETRNGAPARSPNAIKLQANVITCAGTPQHAVEKKSELSAAANPPSTQAGAVKPNRHKQKQAEIPTISKEIGAYVRSNNSGVVASVKAVVIEG